MKKNLFVTVATVFLAALLFSCSKNEEDYLSLEPCGILLPVSTEYMDRGLSCEAYGTDMAIYPVVIIGFSYPDMVHKLYAQAMSEFEKLDNEEEQERFYNELQQRLSVHQKLICELAVIPTKDYKDMKKNPLEGFEFITDMKVLKEKFGNTYLYSTFENTTEGMSDEEAREFLECQDYALKAIRKAKFKKVEIESYDPEKYLSDSQDGNFSFPMFGSMDLNGNTETEEVFKKKDMTLLVLWNVDDSKSCEAVEAISTWSENIPDNIQTVGIVCDINSPTDGDKIQKAKKVTGGRFENIIGAGELQSLKEIYPNLPVALMVDSDGDIWGQEMEGASLDDCIGAVAMWEQADAYLKSLEQNRQ